MSIDFAKKESSISNLYSRKWNIGTMPVRTIAAFSAGDQSSPDSLLGATGDYVRFELPPFQRGLRWKKDKRLKFLESLLAGWPTGAIVLTKVKTENHTSGNGRIFTWSVIDGQQRLATFSILRNDFWKEPWYVFSSEIELGIEEILTVTSVDSALKVKEGIHELTKGTENSKFDTELLEDSENFLSELCRVLRIAYPVESENLIIAKDACKKIRISLRDQKQDLDDTLVGVITIEPAQGATPNEVRFVTSSIFSALNSGIPLKKYEMLAAEWATQYVPWARYAGSNSPCSSDPALLVKTYQKSYMSYLMKDRILDSYRNSEDELELDPEIEELSDEEVNLFDFLYGLSATSKEYPTQSYRSNTWNTAKRSSMPDGKSLSEIAFDVAALLFSGQLGSKAIDSLQALFPLNGADFDIGLFAEHFIGSINVIDESLNSFTKHETRNKGSAGIGRTLATSYITSVINTTYDVKPGVNDRISVSRRNGQRERTTDNMHSLSQARRLANIKANLPAWWLLDTLSEEFQGSSAYQNASTRVWKSFEFQAKSNSKIKLTVENDYLLYAPVLSQFLEVFRNIFTREFRVSAAPINKVPSQSTLTLFHVLFSNKSASMKNYHMDHVVAYKAGKNSGIPRLTNPIPLNHVANWFPLESGLNSSRGNIPWCEYFGRIPDPAGKLEVSSDLFINHEILTGSAYASTDNFGKLMLIRFVGMIDRALEVVKFAEYRALKPEERVAILSAQIVQSIITTLGFTFTAEEIMSASILTK